MTRPTKWRFGLAATLLVAALGFLFLRKTSAPPATPPPRELTRSQLDLRDSRLFPKDETIPFTGNLVETYGPHRPKLEIQICNGKANGQSRGWHENGHLEVEETFVDGVSHGPRTRWFENGERKSLARIDHGELAGPYTEWHDNGQKSVEMTLARGQPDGPATAWFPDGTLQSETVFATGKIVSRKFHAPAGKLARE